MSLMEDKKLPVGSRLSYEGHLCTVRWAGEVKGTKGTWLGVEWDDTTRGKHSGEHNGVRYFECASKSANAASFVRPSRPADPTRSFVQAVKEKYAFDETNLGFGLKPADGYQQNYISGKKAEEVGFDKIRQQQANLQALRIVLVDASRIARPAARRQVAETSLVTDIRETCGRVTDLNISRNLFEEWNEVLDIIRQLDSLQSIRADGLRLRSVECFLPEQVMSTAPFIKITNLSLDDTLLPWPDIVHIAANFPALKSLSASGNEYSALPKTEATLPNTLTSITLERNEFTALSDLAAVLAPLSNLQSLLLKSNAIDNVFSDQNIPCVQFSPFLTNVDLAYNEINDLTFIDSLAAVVPGMTSLRTAHNPVYSNLFSATDKKALTADDGYMLTLARLGQLQTLNYSTITEKERLNAEAYYLSQIAGEIASAGPVAKQDVLKRHARYAQLCEIYGDPTAEHAEPVVSGVDEKSLAARLCHFSFQVDETVIKDTAVSSFDMELPKSLTVYGALGLVGRKLGLQPMLLRLVWKTDELDAAWRDGEEADSEPRLSENAQDTRSKFREEVLVPRIRQLGSWIEGRTATIRVEWSEDDVKRRKARASEGTMQ